MTLAKTRIQALLQGILDHPEDDDRRLVYADAIEDRNDLGDAERAEFIRLQCQLMTGEERAGGLTMWSSDEAAGYAVRSDSPQRERMRRRERELLRIIRDATRFGFPDHRPAWSFYLSRHEDNTPDDWTARLDRGFADKVTCQAQAWLQDGDAITAAHPIREVKLTTEIGWSHRNGGVYLHDWLPTGLNEVKGRRCKNVTPKDNPSDISKRITYVHGCLIAEFRGIKFEFVPDQDLYPAREF